MPIWSTCVKVFETHITSFKRRCLVNVIHFNSLFPMTFQSIKTTSTMSINESQQRFELLHSGKVIDCIPISKWRSKNSGMVLYIADVNGPLVYGNFTIVTEAHDNDGLPHTLEHLIFMGSQNFPYKGVLDKLANRSLASGTNAFTAVDHTCYTLTTAGECGFLDLLPVYLDHIFFPTLKDSAFTTEVHHITGNGEDAGVVYAEMQARGNSQDDLMERALHVNMYDERCGYYYETGGMVIDYHNQFYTLSNLSVTITGQVNVEKVMKIIVEFEDNALERMQERGQYPKPWQDAISPLSHSVVQEVLCPSDEETAGEVWVAWRMPRAEDQYRINCLTTLMDYLTDTAIAPLQKILVDEQCVCSDVSYKFLEYKEGCIALNMSDVLVDKLDSILPMVMDILKRIVMKGDIDMVRMETLIHKQAEEALSLLETEPHHMIGDLCIGDHLFGSTNADFKTRLNPIGLRKRMLEEDRTFWAVLLRQWLLDSHSVTIVGRPSADYMEELADQEYDRVHKQRQSLGPTGLQKMEDALNGAIHSNQKPPKDLLATFPIPRVDSITFHPITVSHNERAIPHSSTPDERFSLDNISFRFQLDDVATDFVKITALLDSSHIDPSLRPYLPLYTEMLFELPLRRGDRVVSYSEVVKEIEINTLNMSASIGIDGESFCAGHFPNIISIYVKTTREKYEKSVELLREILFNAVFDLGRIKVWVKKLLKEISSLKRDEGAILNVLVNDLHYKPACNLSHVTIFKQRAFLEQVVNSLKTESRKIVQDLESIRTALLDTSNLRIHMSVDIKKLLISNPFMIKPQTIWEDFASGGSSASHDMIHRGSSPSQVIGSDGFSSSEVKIPDDLSPSRVEVPDDSSSSRVEVPHSSSPSQVVVPDGSSPYQEIEERRMPPTHKLVYSLNEIPYHHYIMGVGGVESNYMYQTTTSLTGYYHPDLPVLLVLIQYLRQCEGPLWETIRGPGLAYDFDLSLDVEAGLLSFALSEATNLVQTYCKARGIFMDYLDGKAWFTQHELESAISSRIFEIIEKGKTVNDARMESMLSYYRQVDEDYTRQLLNEIAKVELGQLLPIAKTYLVALFDPARTRAAICCHPSHVKENMTEFAKQKFTYVDKSDIWHSKDSLPAH